VPRVRPAAPLTRRSAPLVALGALLVLVVAAALLLAWPPTGRGRGPDEAADSDVQVRDVSVQQTDGSYLLESVHAVVQGDRAFLRVRISWPDESDDAGATHAVPALSGTVLHGAPYAGATATCGTPADLPDAPSPVTVELDCSGLLVPAQVVSVELRD
jgi:hypothetical protein